MSNDSENYAALVDLLDLVEGIEARWFGASTPAFTEADYPLLWIHPIGWEQLDEEDPIAPSRRVIFSIIIITKGQGTLSHQAAPRSGSFEKVPDQIPPYHRA